MRRVVENDEFTAFTTRMDRAERQINWLAFAQEYAAMKWPQLAPNSRRNTARTLTNATLAVITGDRGRPEDDELRTALARWAFTVRSDADVPPDDVANALAWIERNTRDVGELARPAVTRTVLDRLELTKDGRPAAPSTVQRQRGVLVKPGRIRRGAPSAGREPDHCATEEGAEGRPGSGPASSRQPRTSPHAAQRVSRGGTQRGPSRGLLRGRCTTPRCGPPRP